jgi:hypothetical protein
VKNPSNLNDVQFAQPPFFAVSLLKLTVLSLVTIGIYELYWFYRHWMRIRERGEPNIMPFWRAFFAVIYCYPCFARIKLAGVRSRIGAAPPFGLLAICYILAKLSWKLSGPFLLISLLAVVFLLPIQSYVNRINAADSPEHDPNSRFSRWNWVAVVVGGICFILAVIGSFMPNA